MPAHGWVLHTEQVDDDALAAGSFHTQTILFSGIRVITCQLQEPPDEIKRKLEAIARHVRGCTNPKCQYGKRVATEKLVDAEGKYIEGTRILLTMGYDAALHPMLEFLGVETEPEAAVKNHVFAVTLIAGSLTTWGNVATEKV